MGPRLRKMKPYHPRRRTRGKELHKQAIKDIQHRFNADVGDLIALIKEGNLEQATHAQQKAKADFLKYAEEMRQLAQKMGNKFLKAVNEYLNSLDAVIHTSAEWIDEAKIYRCYIANNNLDRELAAA